MMACEHIDRLNIGPIETFRLSWDQPHEGNLFEHLYRQRAFQIEHPEPEIDSMSATVPWQSVSPFGGDNAGGLAMNEMSEATLEEICKLSTALSFSDRLGLIEHLASRMQRRGRRNRRVLSVGSGRTNSRRTLTLTPPCARSEANRTSEAVDARYVADTHAILVSD